MRISIQPCAQNFNRVHKTSIMSIFNSYLSRNNLTVHPYQQKGVAWCVKLETRGRRVGGELIKSGVIADEMGLGKTIQMIGLIICNIKPHTLIVVPRSLLDQWDETIQTTTGHVPLIYHGTGASNITDQDLEDSPIVLTTYGFISTRTKTLAQVKWDRIIYDEAHHLRNSKTRVFKSASKMKASHKWFVTGTPIQNKLKDLYSLCNLMGVDREYYSKINNIGKIVSRLILKRTKAEVGIILPKLTHHSIIVEWSSEKERIIAEDIHVFITGSLLQGCRTINPYRAMNLHIFAILHKARQSCIDMKLINTHSLSLLKTLGGIYADLNINEYKEFGSKVNKLMTTIIEKKGNGKPKLVFCNFYAEIDTVAHILTINGMNVAAFDGRISSNDRETRLKDNTLDALILQINTGCEGLNLQQYKEIYFMTPQWNPAVQDQAIARCHRIGQTEPVDVFNFHMRSFSKIYPTNSLDMHIASVQRRKRIDMSYLDCVEQTIGAGTSVLECAICLASNKDPFTKLTCGHCFHHACIVKWLKVSTTCPICRKSQ